MGYGRIIACLPHPGHRQDQRSIVLTSCSVSAYVLKSHDPGYLQGGFGSELAHIGCSEPGSCVTSLRRVIPRKKRVKSFHDSCLPYQKKKFIKRLPGRNSCGSFAEPSQCCTHVALSSHSIALKHHTRLHCRLQSCLKKCLHGQFLWHHNFNTLQHPERPWVHLPGGTSTHHAILSHTCLCHTHAFQHDPEACTGPSGTQTTTR